jgi:hypothetical protein
MHVPAGLVGKLLAAPVADVAAIFARAERGANIGLHAIADPLLIVRPGVGHRIQELTSLADATR